MLSTCLIIISNWAKFFNIRRNKCNKACSVAGSVHCCAVFTSPCTTGIITAERLLYRSHGQGDARARPASILMADYTMPLRGHGIITAKRLLYRAMPNGSPLARQPPFDGQLYHAASRTWYNNRKAVIIPGYAQRLAACAATAF